MYFEMFQLNRFDVICIYVFYQIVLKVKVDNFVLQNVVFIICKKLIIIIIEVKEEVCFLLVNCVSEEFN